MRSSFCKTLKEKKTSFEILESLSIDDIVWMKSRNEQKFLLLHHLQKQDHIKIIKISKGSSTLMFYPLEIININLSDLYQNRPGIWGSISKKMLSFCKFRIAHPSYSILYDHDLSITDVELISETDKYTLMLESLEKIKDKLHINIITVPSGKQITKNTLKVFHKMNYEIPVEDFTMELPLDTDWATLQDYINALKRKYTKRTQSIKKKSETLLFKTLTLEEINKYEQVLYDLYLEVISSQKFIASTAPKNHFSKLKEIYQDDFTLEAVYEQDEIVAFLTYFNAMEGLQIHYVGLDYSKNEQFDLYFNLLFRCVEIGIKECKSVINFGRTSLDAKASLGAMPMTHHTYVKTHGLSKIIKKCVIHELRKLENNSWKIRKPFKTDVSVTEV